MAQQSAVAAFTPSVPYVDITWPDTSYSTFRLLTGIGTNDATIPGYKCSNVSSSGLRVEPSIPFNGNIYVAIIEVF